MVSTFTAAVLAALGVATGGPAGHAAQPVAPAFFVRGHGWGHGVGMPQYGAYGYALHGWTHQRIVAHYYTGTALGQAQLKKVRVLLVPGAKRVVVSSRSAFFVRDATGKRYKLAAGSQTLGPGLKLKVVAAKEPKALPAPLVFSQGAELLVLGSRAYRGTLRGTANVQDVWPKAAAVPYLVSVPDPYDTLSPYHNWGPLRFTPGLLAHRLHSPGKLVDLRPDVGASGRVRTLTVVGANGERTLGGSDVRRALGLRSTWFQIGLLGLTPPAAPVVFGSQAKLAGLARGVPRVTLEARAHGGQWKPFAPLVPKSGQVGVTVAPKISTDYRLATGEIRSGSVHLAVAPRVRMFISADRLSLTGLARPVLARSAVQIQKPATSGWAAPLRAEPGAKGDFSANLDITPGAYRARVVPGRGFVPGVSRVIKVTG